MDALNIKEAYAYLDGLADDRMRSAALAVHLAYLDCCSSQAGANRMIADASLDLALLYHAAVAAFLDPSIDEAGVPPSPVARVVNREQAQRRLATITDGRHLTLASRFVSEVVRRAYGSPCEQDLLSLLDLFLIALGRATPEMIESGEISKASHRLEDTDYW